MLGYTFSQNPLIEQETETKPAWDFAILGFIFNFQQFARVKIRHNNLYKKENKTVIYV